MKNTHATTPLAEVVFCMNMSYLSWRKPLLLAAALLALAAPPSRADFTAYNSCSSGNTTNGATKIYTGNGFLKNYSDGATLSANVAISGTSYSENGGSGVMPASGTPAYNLFNGKVGFSNKPDSIGTSGSGVLNYVLTFTGLDVSKEYEFVCSANRNNTAYTTRLTTFAISGASSSVYASSSGANWTSNSPTSVTACFGTNLTGYVVSWTKIRPTGTGNNGTFTITATSSSSGYGPSGFMLKETTPVGVTVSITNPVNNASFALPASVLIEATATSTDGSVTNVEFFVDGGSIGSDTAAPYSMTWNSPALGIHTLTAVAEDNFGNTNLSSSIIVSINSTLSVSVTTPTNNSSFAQPSSITIQATATATVGSVTNVAFYIDGSKVADNTTSPYSHTWNSPSVGTHKVSAVAKDNQGNTAQSFTNTVTITPVVITRGPYVQLSTPTSIVVRWRTTVATESRVVYGPSVGSMTTTNFNASAVTDHEITLTGLTPDTRYYYAVGTSAGNAVGPDAGLYFYTHPLPGTPKPTRVWVIGDAGTGDADQTQVRDAFWNFNGTNRVHAWLQLGDNAYNSGYDSEYQTKMFDIYTNQLRNTVTWPTIGNHETAQATGWSDSYPHFYVFSMPTEGQAGGVPSGTEHYYSFDYGMVHFICLDSMTTACRQTNSAPSSPPSASGAMAQWLREDLAATTNRWVIAYFHHPPYTKGSHDSDTETPLIEMRGNIIPILEAGGADLVLAGHSHVYERTCLANGHYGLSSTFNNTTMIVHGGDGRDPSPYIKPEYVTGGPIGNRGTVYAVCGSSGADGNLLDLPATWTQFIVGSRHPGSGTNHGSMVLDITYNRLDARFITQATSPGSVGNTNADWFSIVKNNWAPVASNATVNVKADTSTNLVLAGSDINRNTLTFATNSTPTNGLISAFNPTTGVFTYTPARGASNTEVLRFVASDGSLTSTGQVTLAITPPVDADADGIADSWETQYGVTDPNGDGDGDGASNIQEYWAGTNPTNALSWLRMTAISKSVGSGYQVVWSSVGGARYRITFSNGNAQGGFNGIFTPVTRPVGVEMDSNPIGMPGTMSFTDDGSLTGDAPPNGIRFYRVQVVR